MRARQEGAHVHTDVPITQPEVMVQAILPEQAHQGESLHGTQKVCSCTHAGTLSHVFFSPLTI